MIRIILLGRTGNHLFQYALGRVLAEKHGVPLVMDASWYNREGWAEVSHFLGLPLEAKVTRRASIANRVLRKLTHKHRWEYLGLPVLKERGDDQSFDPAMLNAPADCVLFGYFQTPIYFHSIADSLRAEFNGLFSTVIDHTEPLAVKLSSPGSVAVHVRRQDYLTHSVFRVCERDYYQKTIDELRSRVRDARFLIFSDDPEWCRTEFRDSDQEVIDSGPAGSNPLRDLYLMSLAHHHIIANSTYSWWAAWLGEKTGQIVKMPDRWYAHGIVAPIAEKNPGRWEITH
jgi:hypothetical protein